LIMRGLIWTGKYLQHGNRLHMAKSFPLTRSIPDYLLIEYINPSPIQAHLQIIGGIGR